MVDIVKMHLTDQSPLFHIHPLGRSKLLPAFAVISTVWPHVTEADWHAFAQRRLARNLSGDGGILAAEDINGYILGLATYLVEPDLEYARIALVDRLVSVGLVKAIRAEVFDALLRAIDNLAREAQCDGIRVVASGASRMGQTAGMLAEHDYKRESLVFFKPASGPAGPTRGVRVTATD